MLAGYQSPFDATVVTRLAAAGAVTLGKLNCDEFAMGSANENSAVAPSVSTRPRPCATPGQPIASPAARRAAAPWPWPPPGPGRDGHRHRRLHPPARQLLRHHRHQAHVWPRLRYGMVAFASSLDQAGPMARSAEDCALLLSAMCGPDPDRDSTSLDLPCEDFSRSLNDSIDGLRIGIPAEFFGDGLAPTCVLPWTVHSRNTRSWAQHWCPSICRAPSCPFPCTTSSRGRGFVQPLALRWREVRPPCQPVFRPGGHVQENPRRRVWRRGQAPHHDRRLCSLTATTTPTTCRRRRSAA